MVITKKTAQKKVLSKGEISIIIITIFIIALFTIPKVIRKTQLKQTRMQLQKFNGTVTKMIDNAQATDGYVNTWNFEANTQEGSNQLLEKIAPYIYISKKCGTGDSSCTGGKTYYTLNKKIAGGTYNPNNEDYAKAILTDNSMIFIKSTYGSKCDGELGDTKALQNVCAEINIDLNGTKPPNRYGYDTFFFYLTKYGVVPMGTKSEDTSMTTYCNIYSLNGSNGVMCSGWAMKIGNFDYQKKNITWD